MPAMRQGTCTQCTTAGPLGEFIQHENKLYCRPCTDKLLQSTGTLSGAGVAIDPTICARCHADNGNSEYSRIGELPFCQPCQDYLYANPYPQWLKMGLAALVVLLAVALVHGRKYFQVGREMYIGEKLVDQGRYAEAVPHLKKTVQVAPDSDKAVLLLAKAALLEGDPNTAADAVQGHKGGTGFEQDSDFQQVNALFERASSAITKAKKAMELEQQPAHAQEAAQLMHEAASTYPQLHGLTEALPYYDAGVAFEGKDYDRFLALSQQVWKAHPDSAGAAAEVASALACKYAVTGEESWKQQTEAMLEKARLLSQKSEEDIKAYEEYSERTRYRLASKIIIDKAEYDKRFRSATAKVAQ
jgi:tetratricopeptide (TPR) repeat protein